MAGFREDFYARIGRDYHENMENSFLYGYVKTKRENKSKTLLEGGILLSGRHCWQAEKSMSVSL